MDTTTIVFKFSEKHSTTLLSRPVTSEMVRELLILIPELMDTRSDTMSILSLCLSKIVSPSLQPMVDAPEELKTVQMKVTLAPATTTREAGSVTNSKTTAMEEVIFSSCKQRLHFLDKMAKLSLFNIELSYRIFSSVSTSYQDVHN